MPRRLGQKVKQFRRALGKKLYAFAMRRLGRTARPNQSVLINVSPRGDVMPRRDAISGPSGIAASPSRGDVDVLPSSHIAEMDETSLDKPAKKEQKPKKPKPFVRDDTTRDMRRREQRKQRLEKKR